MRQRSMVCAVALAALVMQGACSRRSPGSAGDLTSSTDGLAPMHRVANLAEARASHAAVTLRDGKVLFIGGFHKGPDGREEVYSATTELYDPRTHRVSAGPSMRYARAGHVAVALVDGSVLVAGGWGETGMQRTAELLDTTMQVWRPAGLLGVARGDASATLLRDGRVVIIGGERGAGPHATIDVYTPDWSTGVGTWTSGGTLSTPRSGHTATLGQDGAIYIVGGTTGSGQLVPSIERYDPTSRTSTVVGALAQPRYKHATQLLERGDLLVIGGSDTRDWDGRLRSTEIFEVATGTTWSGTNLADARFKLAQAVVPLGHDRFAVLGGATSVEVLMTNDSKRVATLPAPMHVATVTRVGQGDVILAGGYDDSLRVSSDVRRITLDGYVNQRR